MPAQMLETESIPEALFPEGDYLANLTPDGKIEVINTRKIKALFSFSQFRERVTIGEFIVMATMVALQCIVASVS